MKNLIFVVLLCVCAWWVDGCAVAKLGKAIPGSVVQGGSIQAHGQFNGVYIRPTYTINFRTLSEKKLCGGRLNVTYYPATIAPATIFLNLTASAISGSAPPGTKYLVVVLDYATKTYSWEIPLKEYEHIEITKVIPMNGGC